MEVYENYLYSAEERAEDLLGKLSLDEKMAQIVGIICMPIKEEKDAEFLKKMCPNGVGQVSGLVMGRFHDVKAASKMQRIMQKKIMEQSEHHIPAIFHMEGLCGAMLQGGMSFPSGIGRGASFDPKLEEEIGAITARQELSVGATQLLCPILDVARDPRHGRFGEAYGEDPTLVAAMGSAAVKGMQSQEIGGLHAAACGKHYMAYHMSQGGINSAHMEIGPRSLREIHGKPFQAAIAKSGLRTVMPCYNASDDGPVSASEELLTKILREEMGLEGTTISDYGAVSNVHTIQHVGETMEEAGYLCLSAGMDVELPMPVAYSQQLKQMFIDGRADVQILDRAVKRVLVEKFRMGLFEHPFGLENEEFDEVYQKEQDKQVSLQAARESLVLLKNDGILPINKTTKKIAIVGPHGNWANHYFGGYSMVAGVETGVSMENSQAGLADISSSNKSGVIMIPGTEVQFSETQIFKDQLKWMKPNCPSLYEYIKQHMQDIEVIYSHGFHIAGDNRDEFEDALNACKDADVILLTLGGKFSSGTIATMGEGVDASDINLPKCQDAFMEEASKLGIPMVGIHFGGRPISSDVADKYLAAIIEAWNPAEYGARAITEVVFGEYNPSGRMPVSTARNAGQIPIYYNHPNGSSWHQGVGVGFQNYIDLSHEPRYYFGQGLSYSSFEYSNLRINDSTENSQKVQPNEEFQVSCDITNTSTVSGTEVVQLYFKDPYASMLRPVQELQGFARVELEPGETKTVIFTCNTSQIAFLNKSMNWKIEAGSLEIFVGASSVDLKLNGEIIIDKNLLIEGRDREFFAKVEIAK